MWRIKISSKKDLGESARELIIDYVNSEGDTVVLSNVIEMQNSIELLLEAKKEDVINLFSVLKCDLKYKMVFSHIRN